MTNPLIICRKRSAKLPHFSDIAVLPPEILGIENCRQQGGVGRVVVENQVPLINWAEGKFFATGY